MASGETLLHLCMIPSTDGIQNLAVKTVVYCGYSKWYIVPTSLQAQLLRELHEVHIGNA